MKNLNYLNTLQTILSIPKDKLRVALCGPFYNKSPIINPMFKPIEHTSIKSFVNE
jgi:hypothetical protein